MRKIRIGLLAAIALPTAAIAQGMPVVTTASGPVRGVTAEGVASWKGIPFAAPPVGALRWRAPQPAAVWRGTRDATDYGHDCMQVPFPSDAAPLGTPPAEDCLYLNVWRPAGVTARLPVIVWIYGGGFVNGGASPPTYSGANIAKQGVMFVSFNYRVGRFGTFAHPQLTREDADGGLLGNYGYMDQIAALKWVRTNIARFGGDPRNVTIIGESAGGMSVHALVTSPLAKGLFAKAVVMSGGNGQAMGSDGLAVAETIGVAFAQSKGIAPDDPQALARLRALSAEDVTSGLNMMALFAPSGPRTFASPFVDGKLAVDAGQAYRSGDFAHVPIMIGATSADIGGKTGMMVAGARSASATIASKGVPVYEYRFSYVADSARTPQTAGAGHASDIPFFFHTETIKYGDKTTPRDQGVGRMISAYIVNFAKTGDPNGAGLPQWAHYAAASDTIMDFAASGDAVPGKDTWGADIDAANPPARP
ncbi:carboxylesterase/lipase family protein [Sphingomonas sp. MMS24-J13]|uniref:carboxylesterase/lipase family protein n=1 Tax=Sphingomonas sp. MMS24-J13 TaxID=3238686 RepID=UPI00384C8C9B